MRPKGERADSRECAELKKLKPSFADHLYSKPFYNGGKLRPSSLKNLQNLLFVVNTQTATLVGPVKRRLQTLETKTL